MYSVLLDDKKYYTGKFSDRGKIKNGIDISTLPPTDDLIKALFYIYDYHDVSSIVQVPVISSITGEQKVDENGDPIFEDKEITTSILEWFFDDVKYQQYLADEAGKIPEPTLEEKVATLINENATLKFDLKSTKEVVEMLLFGEF